MPALDLFSPDFDLGVKSRGRDYFRRRRVKRLDASPDGAITATVEGSDDQFHHVRVEFDEHGDPVYECSCPHFQDNGGYPCKHLWATLLQADQEGVLKLPEGANGRPVSARAMDGESEEEGDDDLDSPPPSRNGNGAAREEDVEAEEDEDDADMMPAAPAMPPPKRPIVSRRPTGPRDDIGAATAKQQVDWRKQLDRLGSSMRQYPQAAAPGGASAAATAWAANRRILYVVDVPATLEGRGLVIELASQVVKRDGTAGERPRQLKIGREQVAALPDPVDRQILQMLLGAHRGDWGYYSYYDADVARRFVLPEAAYDSTFRLMCNTGRARLRKGKEDGADPLVWDDSPPWEFWLEFKPSPGGRYQILDGSLRRNGMRMELGDADLLLRGGLLFAENRVSRYDHRGAFDLVAELRDGLKLSVPLADRDDLLRKLLSLPRLPRMDLPADLEVQEVRPPMRPRLTVKRPGRDADDRLIGIPSFDYGGQIIESSQSAMAQLAEDGKQILYRDPDAETAALAKLVEVGFRDSYEYTEREGANAGGTVRVYRLPISKLPKVVGDLVTDGWHVEAEGKIYRQAGQFKVQVKSGIDWFEMHGQISFGDDLYAPLPRLLQALRRGERTVTLDDGTIGLLPEEWLKRYAPLASIADDENPDHLKFMKSQVGFLDALLASIPESTFDETFGKARDQLMRFEGVDPINPPDSFVGELRAYQREGLGWMQFLRDFSFGGCLADDMGLGKTVQVLALLESRRLLRANGATPKPGPSLAVVPRSLVFNWNEEAKKFTPNLKVLDHTHAQRQKGAEGFEEYDLILTTYGTLRRDAAYFKDVRFDYAILDEAQAVKNAASESAKAVRLLNADHRLALSGTPVQNHLGELWSLLEFLNPGMMGAASVFKTTGAGSATVAPEARQLLARAIRPFVLRRTKEQVAKDLPAKLEQTIFCELEPAQRKLYDELRQHYRTSLLERIAREGINKAKIEVLEALLRLRQAACHPGLIDKAKSGESSAKLETLLDHVNEVIEEGHKVLVFSQFTSLLAIVKAKFDEQKTVYEYLDGKTRDRQARVDRFQNDPDCKLFLISLKAGGLGLNLTKAEYVFLLDPWWNPAVEAQAIDRAHRIGQVNQVFAYRLIAKDTVEEKVLQLQQSKKDLADAIINADNSLIRTLGKEDLELLLS